MLWNVRRIRILALGALAFPMITTNPAPRAADVNIDLGTKKQVIDGFGASSAWCGTIGDNVMNTLYGDLGFSILRVRIEEGIGDNWKSGPYTSWAPELANAKKAVAKGAIVFATPWNPPASLRLNTGTSNAKYSTDPSKWSSYRDYLNAYVKYFKDNGVSLHAISVQNEPDYAKDWTNWTPTQAHDFVLNYGASIDTRLISAESFSFSKNMYDQILNDTKALENVDILGLHLYGTPVGNFAYPLFESKGRPAGKKLWMTEHYIGEKETDVNIANTVAIGKEIHDCMVTGNMSAYVYWWITWPNGLAKSDGTIYQRAHAIGQFAKYIRPGYNRVDATATPATNVYVSAYAGADKLVIVAVNTGTGAVTQKFNVQNANVGKYLVRQTTSNTNMATLADVSATANAFSANLPAQSITTFVGTIIGTGTTPRNAATLEGFHAAPTKDGISVVSSNLATPYSVTVRSFEGRIVASRSRATGTTKLQVGTKGSYLVEIESEGRTTREMVAVF